MKKFYNLILLDESGSMDCIRRSALSAMNETIQTIKRVQKEHNEHEHSVTFVTFSGRGTEGVKFICLNVPVEAMRKLRITDYFPDGCTPLYDAIGSAVETLEKLVTEDDVVLVSIITDGQENSSSKFSGSQIRDLIGRKKECGWTFTYMGANQDSAYVARNIGIVNALDFEASEEGVCNLMEKYTHSYASFCCRADSMISDQYFFKEGE